MFEALNQNWVRILWGSCFAIQLFLLFLNLRLTGYFNPVVFSQVIIWGIAFALSVIAWFVCRS